MCFICSVSRLREGPPNYGRRYQDHFPLPLARKKWNRNIWAIPRKNKLWKYTQSEFPKADKDNLLTQSQWDDKVIEVAVMMTPMTTTGIQAKLTEDEFNDGYKMYWRLKELLELMGETQVMRLTQEYYTLSC